MYYNPFTDTFYLDVPENKKTVSFFAVNLACIGETFTYDMSGMCPYSVQAGGKTYDEIWKVFEPYINGASTKMIPTDYKEGHNE